MELMRHCYQLSRRLPIEERFALADQIRRAAASVPANITEGHESPYRRVFLRALRDAQGSLSELECHLLVCEQVGYLSRDLVEDALALSGQVGRMLRAMRHGLGEPPPRLRPRDAKKH
jgi:four helix bundle protein